LGHESRPGAISFAADSHAQETLQPYAPPILHTFLDSANVFPESVTVDLSSGTFFVGSVKEGTIYKGKIARPGLQVFSPGGADGRSIATSMFFANVRLVVVGRQTGLIFMYNTQNGRLISKLDNAVRCGNLMVPKAPGNLMVLFFGRVQVSGMPS
jgi:hypothetical protein